MGAAFGKVSMFTDEIVPYDICIEDAMFSADIIDSLPCGVFPRLVSGPLNSLHPISTPLRTPSFSLSLVL
jgi:hypothetical protein